MSPFRIGLRRLIAFGVDWVVIAAWGGLLFGVVMGVTGGRGYAVGGPWKAQAIGFLAMTLPVMLYFSLSESSSRQGTLGKRVLRLRVVDVGAGGRLPLGRSLLRTTVILLPWELGHTMAQQSFYAGEGSLPGWVWICAVISLALPVLWVSTILIRNRALYDDLAKAEVKA